jgi:hypothetical protein
VAFLDAQFLNVRPWNEWSEYNAHVVKRAKRKPALAASRAQVRRPFSSCSARASLTSVADHARTSAPPWTSLQAILKFCLIRRNKDSKIDGVPILTLKPKHISQSLLLGVCARVAGVLCL